MFQPDFAELMGELSMSAPPRGRQTERTPVAMAAGLRQRGATGVGVRILDLSTNGFRAMTQLELEPGFDVWLKLAGLETLHSHVKWVEGNRVGCQFVRPLHPAVLEMVLRRPS